MNEESFSVSPVVDVLCLMALAAFLSFWGLASGPGLGEHEALVAQGARNIRQGGPWLIPHVNEIPFVRKTPLPFWLTAGASIVVDSDVVTPPVSPLAARLPSALAAILTVALVYVAGLSMFGHRCGLVAGLVMAVSAGGFFFSHNGQVEMVLTLFCTATFTFFWLATECGALRTGYLVLMYVAFALAMLAKAPLPITIVAFPLAVWWLIVVPLAKLHAVDASDGTGVSRAALIARQVRRLRELWSTPGMLLFLLMFLPWPIYVYFKVENALDLWRIEFLARYTGELSTKVSPGGITCPSPWESSSLSVFRCPRPWRHRS